MSDLVSRDDLALIDKMGHIKSHRERRFAETIISLYDQLAAANERLGEAERERDRYKALVIRVKDRTYSHFAGSGNVLRCKYCHSPLGAHKLGCFTTDAETALRGDGERVK